MTQCAGGAQRQAGHGAHMVLELAGHGAFDGPVARVVDPGSHFIRDQPPTVHEELDGQYPDIVKGFEHARQARGRGTRERRGVPGREREPQYARGVIVAIERIERDLATAAACTDDRHFIVERHELFIQQRHAAELPPGASAILRLAQHTLSLAVVAEAAGLEYAGNTDALDSADRKSTRLNSSHPSISYA